jgi:hypothetical protein
MISLVCKGGIDQRRARSGRNHAAGNDASVGANEKMSASAACARATTSNVGADYIRLPYTIGTVWAITLGQMQG